MSKKIEKKVDELFSGLWPETSTEEGIADLKRRMSEIDRNLNGRQLEIAFAKMATSLVQRINEHGGSFEEYLRMGMDLIKKDAHIYTGIGRKLHTALDMGSFDPVHMGHFIRAQVVRDNSVVPIDDVWMMPSNMNLGSKQLLKPKHRLNMIDLGLERRENRGISLFDYEIQMKSKGSTFNTVKFLAEEKKYENRIFYLVVGADIVDSVPNWRNGQYLIRHATFIVVSRPGYSLKHNAWYTKYPHFIIESDNLIKASSTDVKKFIASGDQAGIDSMLYPENYEYIKKHKLYGA